MFVTQKSRTLALTGLCAALIVIGSLIAIPMPSGTPVTLQTFAVAMAGYLLGVKPGMVSVLVYLALGAIGLPVFSGFSGGVGRLVGVTGGFLWGFVAMAALCGIGRKCGFCKGLLWGMSGLALCHIAGIVQFSAVTENPFGASALVCSVPYLCKDILLVAGAKYLAETIERRVRCGA